MKLLNQKEERMHNNDTSSMNMADLIKANTTDLFSEALDLSFFKNFSRIDQYLFNIPDTVGTDATRG